MVISWAAISSAKVISGTCGHQSSTEMSVFNQRYSYDVPQMLYSDIRSGWNCCWVTVIPNVIFIAHNICDKMMCSVDIIVEQCSSHYFKHYRSDRSDSIQGHWKCTTTEVHTVTSSLVRANSWWSTNNDQRILSSSNNVIVPAKSQPGHIHKCIWSHDTESQWTYNVGLMQV